MSDLWGTPLTPSCNVFFFFFASDPFVFPTGSGLFFFNVRTNCGPDPSSGGGYFGLNDPPVPAPFSPPQVFLSLRGLPSFILPPPIVNMSFPKVLVSLDAALSPRPGTVVPCALLFLVVSSPEGPFPPLYLSSPLFCYLSVGDFFECLSPAYHVLPYFFRPLLPLVDTLFPLHHVSLFARPSQTAPAFPHF